MLLNNKTIIITGGSKGIGKAISLECIRHGANVIIGHSSGADDVISEANAIAPGKAVAVKGDIASHSTAQILVDKAVEHFGKLDVLISNAGICPFHSFVDTPMEVFKTTQEVNFHGAFYVAQAAAKQMIKQNHGGAIIAVSSISALVGGEFQAHYTPTKAALHSLMQSAAISLGRHNIRCNSLLPGTILTRLNEEDLADEEKRQYFEKRIPLGRFGLPEDIAGPAVFLASDMAAYVNGAALLVDGGMFVNLQ